MKKFLSILLIFFLIPVFIHGTMAETSKPEVFTSGDYSYIILEDGTAEITRYKGFDSNVEIPEAFDGRKISSIGDDAFRSCFVLKEIWIPDSVIHIGRYAFEYCKNLLVVHIPDSIQTLGTNPFALCFNLAGILVSSDHPYLASIDGALFSKNDRRLVCLFNELGKDKYTIPQGIRVIDNYAFSGCTGLTEITLPDSVTSIGDSAFYSCKSLTGITIPDSLESIGKNPFSNCEHLLSISVSPDHPYLATIDGVLFSKPDKRLVTFPCALNVDTYTLPEGTQIIGEFSFNECKSLKEVIIPEGVTGIGEYAFTNCGSLKKVTIPASVTSIGDFTFAFCTGVNITVSRDSYAASYCMDHSIGYTYSDAFDWLDD